MTHSNDDRTALHDRQTLPPGEAGSGSPPGSSGTVGSRGSAQQRGPGGSGGSAGRAEGSSGRVAFGDMGPLPAMIGRYRVLGVLGVGGMGIVYRAVQERPHRAVALKLMRPGLLSPRLLRRFEYEAEVLGRLQHEGIARIYEAGVDHNTGQPFFAMELVEGLRLDDFARRHEMDSAKRLQLLVKISAAVHYAHQRGVVHRDLKPANIIITRDGQPKILDFGVARLTDLDTATATMQTDPGQMVGTLTYMAPEQITGKTDEVDTRSDVYALGVLAYELLSGHPPLNLGELPLPEAVRAVVEDEPHRLSRYDRTFRGDLETIVGKAMAKEKERRYSTAADFAEDVQHYLRYEPIAARPATSLYYLRKFARRNKLLVAAVAAAVVILLVGLFGTTWGLVHAQRERERAESAREISEVMNDYLQDAFHGVDPVHSKVGRPLTAVELVRHAALDLEKDQRFKDYPLEKSDLQNYLGVMLATLGHPSDAEKLLREAVDARKEHLGPKHDRTLISMNNLASVLKNLGRPGEAEPIFRETLEAFTSKFGAESPAVLRSRKNLGGTLLDMGRAKEAEAMLREAFEGREKVLGLRHADTMLAAIDLAEALAALDRPAEAEALLRPAIAELERYGPNDPDRMRAKQSLANALQKQGKVEEVEELFESAYEGFGRLYGSEHPQTIRAASNYGGWLQYLRRPREAEPVLRQAIRGYERTLGPEDPKTLVAKAALANAVADQGRLDEAEPMFRETLDSRRRVLGPDHPDTLATMQALAGLLIDQKKYAEGDDLHRRAVAGMEKRFGEDHPRTLSALGNLAQSLQAQERLDEAEPVARKVLEGLGKASGDTHPNVLVAAHNLADIVERRGDQQEAEELYRRAALRARERLGPSNPLTRQFAGRWGRSLMRLGLHDQAAEVFADFELQPLTTQPSTRPTTAAAAATTRAPG